MKEFLKNFLTTGAFIPHGHCYLWKPELVWLHIISDSLIALAYYSIPLTLVYFVRKRQDLPFNWMFLLFGSFIIACGTTHLMEIWTLWYPTYWLSGAIKALSATVSIYTALELVPLVPQALALPSPAQLAAANIALEKEITERKQTEVRINQLNAELERRVFERTAELEIAHKLKDEWLRREQMARQQVTNILESISDAFFALDNEWRFTYLNQKAEHFLRRSHAELLGKNIWQEFPETIGNTFYKQYHRVVAENVTVHFEEFYASLNLWVEVRAYPAVNGLSVYFHDITERKRQAAILAIQNRILEMIARSAPLEEVLVLLTKLIDEQSDQAVCSILLLDESGTKLYPATGANIPESYNQGLAVAANFGTCGTAAYTGQTVIVSDIAHDPKWVTLRDLALSNGLRACWTQPILDSKGNVLGTFAMYYPLPRCPSNRDRQLVEVSTHLAAIAIDRKQVEAERIRVEQQIRELNADLERRVAERTAQLEAANKELEAFSYSVSHDLRSPLRSIDGFSLALLERYESQLDDKGKHYLQRVRAATQRMGELIDDLLKLSWVTRSEMQCQTVDLSDMVQAVAAEISQTQPERQVELIIVPGVVAQGDPKLLRVVFENLLNNAWKFTATKLYSKIEFNTLPQSDDTTIYFVSDNGAGFDMAYANKLFGAFQRLHTADEFPGTGIGLATVQRIIHRHGGRVWAEGAVGEGATFYFTLSG